MHATVLYMYNVYCTLMHVIVAAVAAAVAVSVATAVATVSTAVAAVTASIGSGRSGGMGSSSIHPKRWCLKGEFSYPARSRSSQMLETFLQMHTGRLQS